MIPAYIRLGNADTWHSTTHGTRRAPTLGTLRQLAQTATWHARTLGTHRNLSLTLGTLRHLAHPDTWYTRNFAATLGTPRHLARHKFLPSIPPASAPTLWPMERRGPAAPAFGRRECGDWVWDFGLRSEWFRLALTSLGYGDLGYHSRIYWFRIPQDRECRVDRPSQTE